MTPNEALNLLDLSAPITPEELKQAYREALMVWHPDRFGDQFDLRQKATYRTQLLNEAFSLLNKIPATSFPWVAHPPSTINSTFQNYQHTQTANTSASPISTSPNPKSQSSFSAALPKNLSTRKFLYLLAALAVVTTVLLSKNWSRQRPLADAYAISTNLPEDSAPTHQTSSPAKEPRVSHNTTHLRTLSDSELRSLAPLSVRAAVELGTRLAHTGLLEDQTEARKWLEPPAISGDALAQFVTGQMANNKHSASEADLETAFHWFKKSADQGYAPAQMELSRAYMHSRGVQGDINETIRLSILAVEQGCVEAAYTVGMLISTGLYGAPIDKEKGLKWKITAAESNIPWCQAALADEYYEGSNTSQDLTKSEYWYRKAAEFGSPEGQFGLGRLYFRGEVVKKSWLEAHKWLSLALSAKDPALFDDKKRDQAQQALLVIEAQLSADRIRDARNSAKTFTAAKAPQVFDKNRYDDEFLTRKSNEWATSQSAVPDPLDKSAARSEAQEIYQAAMIRWRRRSSGVDETEAKVLFRQAADLGHPEAQMVMGEITENFGMADTAAQRKAFLWFSKAAVQGLPEAQYRVGECHYFGTGTPRNLERAASWYLTAANDDNPHAQDAIARLFEYGEGVAEDPIKAREWSLKAATKGIHRSAIRLATIYERGAGVTQDFVEAYHWYLVADLINAKIDAQRKAAGLPSQTHVSGRGDTLGKDAIRNTISLDDVSEAKKRASEFFDRIIAIAEIPRFSRRQNERSSLLSPPSTSRVVPQLDGREINGSIFHNELEKLSGHGNLTVVNGLAKDAIIKITAESQELTRFYVRFGHSFTLEGIPDGKYTLMFCSGDKWNPEHQMFTENLSAQKYSDPLHFVTKVESSVSGRTLVSDVVTITLHKVADGNVRSEPISPSEFQTEDSTQQ